MTSTARPAGSRPMPYPRSEQQLCTHAAAVREEMAAQDRAWGTKGWTRRRFIAGAGMAGVAAVGTQLVTSRVSYSAAATPADKTLIVVFLRGAADGLRILQPTTSALGRGLPELGASRARARRRGPDRAAEQRRLGDQRQPQAALRRAVVDRRAGLRAGRLVDRASAAATSRPSSGWRRAVRTPRRPAGSTARWPRWVRARPSARWPRGRRRRRRWPATSRASR